MLDIEVEKRLNLKYSRLDEISFCFFVVEFLTFSGNYVIEVMTLLYCYFLYNMVGDSLSVEITGFIFQYICLFSFLSYDFQETVGIILGPYYGKLDAKNYCLYKYRLIFLNVLFWLVSCISIAFIGPFYRSINLDQTKLEIYTVSSYWMFFLRLTTHSVACFLKGRLYILISLFNIIYISVVR